ncbi:MAG: hypothetical protein QUS14_01215 [Pyrinomonadaceae bacterium]|nr:hypothetical protein [Pyrinomonadaceae bacterium]
MKGPDYPVEHFRMMCKIAEGLRAKDIQLLSHEYHYQAFGSWLIEYMRVGERFRIVFDGKESQLRIDVNLGDWMKVNWKEVNAQTVSKLDADGIGNLALLMIGETSN